MTPKEKWVDMAMAWAFGLIVGFAIGHVQQYNWTIVRENALITQIKKQDCDEVIYPEMIKEGKSEIKAYASKKIQPKK